MAGSRALLLLPRRAIPPATVGLGTGIGSRRWITCGREMGASAGALRNRSLGEGKSRGGETVGFEKHELISRSICSPTTTRGGRRNGLGVISVFGLGRGSTLSPSPKSLSPTPSLSVTAPTLARLAIGPPRVQRTKSVSSAFETARHFCSSKRPSSPPDPTTPAPKPSPPSPPPSPPRLSEDIYTLPNILTTARLLATPLLCYLIVNPTASAHFPLGAPLVFITSGFTDWLDGHLARKWNQKTVFGSIADPLADKALMTTAVLSLAYKGALSPGLAVLILGRDISLALAALYYRYASLPKPKTVKRYWDPSLPSAVVHPTGASKANTFLQLSYLFLLMVEPLLVSGMVGGTTGLGVEIPPQVMMAAQAVVASTTLWSWAEYVLKPDAVTILGKSLSEQDKKKVGVNGRRVIGAGLAVCAFVWLWMSFGGGKEGGGGGEGESKGEQEETKGRVGGQDGEPLKR